MNKSKLWIISELFYPDQTSTAYILGEIAKKMESKYRVEVITGPEFYDNDKIGNIVVDPELESLKKYRVWSPKLNKNRKIQRCIRLLCVSFGIFFKALFKIGRNDKILLVTNPVPLIILMSFVKKLRKNNFVLLVHDVFPENTIPTHILSSDKSKKYKILLSLFNNAYSSFDEFIVLGRDMKKKVEEKTLKNKFKKIHIIGNWSDVDIINNKYKEKHNDSIKKIILNYAGNIGRGQGLIDILNIISNVKNNEFEFHIYGSGAELDNIKLFIKEHNLENKVKLYGPYAREKQNEVLNDCDIALISLNEGMFGLGVPSKTYNILASGKPILYYGDKNSEIDLLVNEEKNGYSFSRNDREELILFLENLTLDKKSKFEIMGQKSRLLAETKYSKEKILERYYKIL